MQFCLLNGAGFTLIKLKSEMFCYPYFASCQDVNYIALFEVTNDDLRKTV